MKEQKEILKLLADNRILYVLIGGYAMRIYNSPRITHDVDLAIRTLDVDAIIDILYGHKFFLAYDAGEDGVLVKKNPGEAKDWVENSKSGSMSFIKIVCEITDNCVFYKDIDPNSQIDFLFELSVPILRLKERAVLHHYEDLDLNVVSMEDLLTLKKDRKNKSASDIADIEFLEALLKGKGGSLGEIAKKDC